MSTATIQASFGNGSSTDAYAVIELDETRNVDADGQGITSFDGSETVWFVLHCQPGYQPATVYCSLGMVTACGDELQARSMEGAVWTPEQTSVELPHYPSGQVAASWQGNEITVAISGRSLTAVDDPLSTIARANLDYVAAFWLYRWDPPSGLILADEEQQAAEIMITLEATP